MFMKGRVIRSNLVRRSDTATQLTNELGMTSLLVFVGGPSIAVKNEMFPHAMTYDNII